MSEKEPCTRGKGRVRGYNYRIFKSKRKVKNLVKMPKKV
jgi:hypothetical protein